MSFYDGEDASQVLGCLTALVLKPDGPGLEWELTPYLLWSKLIQSLSLMFPSVIWGLQSHWVTPWPGSKDPQKPRPPPLFSVFSSPGRLLSSRSLCTYGRLASAEPTNSFGPQFPCSLLAPRSNLSGCIPHSCVQFHIPLERIRLVLLGVRCPCQSQSAVVRPGHVVLGLPLPGSLRVLKGALGASSDLFPLLHPWPLNPPPPLSGRLVKIM